MRLGTSFTTRADPVSAYAYLVDFSRIVEWDPFVVRAETLDDGEPRVGSRYRIVGRPLGHEITLDYRITELEAPRRIRLAGHAGRGFDGWDRMTLAPAPGGGTTVRYDAEVRLHGWARLLWLLVPAALLVARLRVGEGPMGGMQRRLDALAGDARPGPTPSQGARTA